MCVACRNADIITGPLGILSADSLHGEITPGMATAVGKSDAVKILIPMSKCDTVVVGVEQTASLTELIAKAREAVCEAEAQCVMISKRRSVWKAFGVDIDPRFLYTIYRCQKTVSSAVADVGKARSVFLFVWLFSYIPNFFSFYVAQRCGFWQSSTKQMKLQ